MKKTIIFAMVAIVAIAGSLTFCGKNVASSIELIVPGDTIYIYDTVYINDTVVTFKEYDETDITNTSMKMYQQTHTEEEILEVLQSSWKVAPRGESGLVPHTPRIGDGIYKFGSCAVGIRLDEPSVYVNEVNTDIFIYGRKAPRMGM